MRQKFDSKTSLSGENSYKDYLKNVSKQDKAILLMILSKLEEDGKEALKYLGAKYLKEGKVSIKKSRWEIFGYIRGNKFELDLVKDVYCK